MLVYFTVGIRVLTLFCAWSCVGVRDTGKQYINLSINYRNQYFVKYNQVRICVLY